jgi:hypothetical protein
VEVPVSKDDKEIKITDKRMFTADGELREEYRFLGEKSTAAAPAATDAPTSSAAPAGPAASAAASAAPARADQPRAASSGGASASPFEHPSGSAAGGLGEPPPQEAGGAEDFGPRLEIPGSPPGLGPSFYDLAAMLAEPVAVYLGDMELPDGQSAENLEMARLYIDLLDVLRQKTAGNLTAQESAFLEDLLYRLRVRYVQKRG